VRLDEVLAGRLFFPLHERLRGRATVPAMRGLETLLGRTSEEVQLECGRRLRQLLHACRERLPYYRNLFRERGVDPDGAEALAELAKLPILDKRTVRANAAGMIDTGVRSGPQPCVSGGTSGDTLHFFVSRERQAQTMGARLFMQSLFGVQPGDRRAWLWGSPIELKRSRIRRLRDRLINERVFDAFVMSDAAMDEYASRIATWQPRLLIGYSSAVARLAERLSRRRDPRDFRALRVVVVTGDEITAEQRRTIEQAFGCRVAAEYGSREVGLIAHECPTGSLHVLSPVVHVEVMRNGRPVPAGVAGQIVCTNLAERAQPLVRYAVGDLAASGGGPCACGLPLPTLAIHAGRVTGFIALPDGRLCHGHAAAYLVRSDERVREFRVVQHALDRIEVLIATESSESGDIEAGVRERFANQLGAELRVHCRFVPDIPPDPSGKRRHLISHVAHADGRFEFAASADGPATL
jgi:phenylacetate-CoA ligase